MAELDLGAVAHDDAVLDHGAQLADVAGPIVVHEGGQDVVGKGFHGLAIGLGDVFEKVVAEDKEITLALPQRGHVQGDNAEAPIQIFPEGALFDHLSEVAIGGGDDADIDLDGLTAADALDGLLTESAEELDLGAGVDFTDLIQEQGTAVRLLKAANAALHGSGEGALFMAEEFAFEDLRGESGAVDGNQLGGGAAAEVMHGAGDEFFAGAAFTFDQNRGARGRDLLDGVDDLFHGVRLAEDAMDGEFAFDLLAELLVFLFQTAAAQGAFDEELDFIQVDGLGNKVPGTAAHGLDGGIDAAVGGHHDADRRLRELQGFVQELHAVVCAESEVGEHDSDVVMAQMLQGLGGVGGDVHIEVVLEGEAEAVAGVFFVVNDEDGGEVGDHEIGSA